MQNKIILLLVIFFTTSLLSAGDLIHKVEKGDTLYSISRKYDISYDEIAKLNDLSSKFTIKVGQELLIKKESKSEPTKEMTTYIVKKGDTLYSISKKLNIKVDELISINDIKNNKIYVNQKLSTYKTTTTVAVEKPTKENLGKDDKPKVVSSKGATWPIDGDVSIYNDKLKGVKISSDVNQKVSSINSGQVVFKGPYRKHGDMIIISGNNHVMYVYAGFSKLNVEMNDKIEVGDFLGSIELDSSDSADGYFFVYKDNEPIDPFKAPRY